MIDYKEKIKEYQQQAPVRVGRVIKGFGLKLYLASFGEENIAGSIIYDYDEDKYKIYVNKNDKRERQRFTAAHELAHYLLHKDIIGDGITEDPLYRNSITNKYIEVEANVLAAEILMPRHLLIKSEYQNLNIQELAKIFEVSFIAMAIRKGLKT